MKTDNYLHEEMAPDIHGQQFLLEDSQVFTPETP